MKLRALLCDDHYEIRLCLRLMLERLSFVELVGECSDRREAVRLVERLGPNVLFLGSTPTRTSGKQ